MLLWQIFVTGNNAQYTYRFLKETAFQLIFSLSTRYI